MAARVIFYIAGVITGVAGIIMDELFRSPIHRAVDSLRRRVKPDRTPRWAGGNKDAIAFFQTWQAGNLLARRQVVERWEEGPVRWPIVDEGDFEACVEQLVEGQEASTPDEEPMAGIATDNVNRFAGRQVFRDSWVGSLVGCDPLWRESSHPEDERLELRFAPARYVEVFAVDEYAKTHLDEWRAWQQSVDENSTRLHRLPPGTFWVSVTVTSADRRLLAWRRSGAVLSGNNLWSIGTDETMKPPTGGPGDESGTLFDLARRSLAEEVGLVPDDYDGRIYFSSIGVRRDAFHFPRVAIAHVWSNLTAAEIESAWIHEAESRAEHADLTWIRPDRSTLRDVAASKVVRAEGRDIGREGWLFTNWAAATGRWAMRDPYASSPRS